MPIRINAVVSAFMGGDLNWAVITTGQPLSDVNTMIGNGSRKSVEVEAGANGRLAFDFIVNAFAGTAWQLTLTEVGAANPRYERAGITDHNGRGHDGGMVDFSGAIALGHSNV